MLHVPCHPVFICVLFVIQSRTIALWANVICCTYTRLWIKLILSYLYFIFCEVYIQAHNNNNKPPKRRIALLEARLICIGGRHFSIFHHNHGFIGLILGASLN